jgi:hypothetical protein
LRFNSVFQSLSGGWISCSNPKHNRLDHLSVFSSISAHIHLVQPLLTGYSRNGRFISNQRGNINYGTMPFTANYSPLEVFQKYGHIKKHITKGLLPIRLSFFI